MRIRTLEGGVVGDPAAGVHLDLEVWHAVEAALEQQRAGAMLVRAGTMGRCAGDQQEPLHRTRSPRVAREHLAQEGQPVDRQGVLRRGERTPDGRGTGDGRVVGRERLDADRAVVRRVARARRRTGPMRTGRHLASRGRSRTPARARCARPPCGSPRPDPSPRCSGETCRGRRPGRPNPTPATTSRACSTVLSRLVSKRFNGSRASRTPWRSACSATGRSASIEPGDRLPAVVGVQLPEASDGGVDRARDDRCAHRGGVSMHCRRYAWVVVVWHDQSSSGPVPGS